MPPGPLFSHEPARGRQSLSNAERYLASAAYVDPKYAALVIREFLGSRRAVVPADIDLKSIVLHSLRSQRLRFMRDISLSVVLIVSLCLSPVPTVALMASVAFLGILQAFCWNRASAGVRLLAVFGGVIALAIAVAAWAAIGFTGPLVPDIIAIPVALCLCAAILVCYVAVRNRMLAEYLVPGALALPPAFAQMSESAHARLAAVARACYGNLMLSDDGESILGVAAGSQSQSAGPFRNWSLTTMLRPHDARQGLDLRGMGDWVRIDPVVLHQSIRQRLLSLNDPGLPVNERIAALAVKDLIIGGSRIRRDSPLWDHAGLTPYSHVSRDAVDALIRHPQAELHYYQWVHIAEQSQPVMTNGRMVIDGHDGGAEISALIRVGVEGHMLFLEFIPGALPSVKEEYQIADRISGSRSRWKAVRDVASSAFLDVALAPVRVLPNFRSMTTKPSDRVPHSIDVGARVNVQVLGAAQALTGRQLLDASRHMQMIEREVLDAVRDFLDANGADAGEFEASAQVILDKSTFIPDAQTTSPGATASSVTRVKE
jgi:hypothetical protein